jgi:hypothetical protein
MFKPFDAAQYEADDNAKHQIIALFRDCYQTPLWVNGDKYGIDLVGKYQGQPFGVEVEIKHNWTEAHHFPFETVHIAARKTKFLDAFPFVYFTVLNHDRTQVLIVDSDQMEHCKLVRKQTMHTPIEWFMEIPISRFTQFGL